METFLKIISIITIALNMSTIRFFLGVTVLISLTSTPGDIPS